MKTDDLPRQAASLSGHPPPGLLELAVKIRRLALNIYIVAAAHWLLLTLTILSFLADSPAKNTLFFTMAALFSQNT